MLSLLHHYILSKSKDFEKVYKTDNQLLLKYVMWGRFANAPLKINSFICDLFLFNYKLKVSQFLFSSSTPSIFLIY